ncbi:MAG: trimeric intracellular cation channel family protein [Deferribacterales bacterium]
MTLLYFLDLLGTFAFAVSGALAGARKELDIYGICFLAVVTAVGGGTVRDTMLGRIPPFLFNDLNYLFLSLLAAVMVFLFHSHVKKKYNLLVWMDALGLGVFNVIGINIAMHCGVGYIGSMIFGVMTGTLGGMMRDVLIGSTPFVLTSEVYASACIAGGALFCGLDYAGFPPAPNTALSAVLVFFVRMYTLKRGLHLPKVK